MRQITISNESTVATDADAAACVAALQKQVSDHFAPVWGLDASLVFHSGKPPSNAGEVIHILDDSDQADALGYHDLGANDVPEGFAFARTSQADNDPWQTVVSHELLEQLADPGANLISPAALNGQAVGVAWETCDPVEGDWYFIDSVPVSNFVFPSWFLGGTGAGKVDYLGKLQKGLSMTPGGYIAYTPDLQTWQQVFASRTLPHHRATPPLSRRGKRAHRQAAHLKLPPGFRELGQPAPADTPGCPGRAADRAADRQPPWRRRSGCRTAVVDPGRADHGPGSRGNPEHQGVRLSVRTKALLLLFLTVSAVEASSPAEAVAAAAADVVRLPLEDRCHVRYFWVSAAVKDRADLLAAFKLHVNLISRESEMADVAVVQSWLWRIDLRDVEWGPLVFEHAAAIDPFFHARVKLDQDTVISGFWPGGVDRADGQFYKRGKFTAEKKKGDVIDVAAPWLDAKAVALLREFTSSETPIVEASWFLTQSARQLSLRNKQTGLGYYDFLQVKDRAGYFKLIGLDEQASIQLKREIRAALDLSGVSQQNRQVVRLQSLTGGAWVTLDVKDQAGAGVAVRNLRRGELKHDAEEWYGFLSNNLPATFLADARGVRQDSAPDFVGPDDSPLRAGRDSRIHVNLACLRCHAGQVLQPVDDYVRKTFRLPPGTLKLGSVDRKTLLELRRQYLSDLGKWLRKDRADYVDAFRQATVTTDFPKGLEAGAAIKLYARAFHAYADRPVSLDDAARELGVSRAAWLSALKRFAAAKGEVDLALATYLDDPPGSLSRLTWEDAYPIAQLTLKGTVPIEVKK